MTTLYISRKIEALLEKSRKSVLLLGPRQTGKSTLVKSLHPELSINLADESVLLQFAQNPRELFERLKAKPARTVFIDEVQRLPSLLNNVQVILDDSPGKHKFYLTGSSARKLRRGQANLLPGRIHTYFLGPLGCDESGYAMDVRKALERGTLPQVYIEEDPAEAQKTLRSYAGIYVKEEIQAEALTRNIEGFSRFLLVAAASSARHVDHTKLSSEAQINRQSAMRYFEILEDTLVIRRCEAFAASERRRLIQHPKYYFFDTGVLNALLGNFNVSDDRKGFLFETLFFNQLMTMAGNADLDIRVSTYRTENNVEVDFIVEKGGETCAVELKASASVGAHDCKGLKSFADFYGKRHRKIVAYLGETARQSGDVSILPWQEALKGLIEV